MKMKTTASEKASEKWECVLCGEAVDWTDAGYHVYVSHAVKEHGLHFIGCSDCGTRSISGPVDFSRHIYLCHTPAWLSKKIALMALGGRL